MIFRTGPESGAAVVASSGGFAGLDEPSDAMEAFVSLCRIVLVVNWTRPRLCRRVEFAVEVGVEVEIDVASLCRHNRQTDLAPFIPSENLIFLCGLAVSSSF